VEEAVTDQQILDHLERTTLLADGGLETSLIFGRGIDLPLFAAFPLIESEDGIAELRRYFEPFLTLAAERGLGYILEAPTWRASRKWADELGIAPDRLARINHQSIRFLEGLREEFRGRVDPILISGCIGPRDDGHHPDRLISAEYAQTYHSDQAAVFAESGVDLISAMTITGVGEAVGIVKAVRDLGLPVVISFTLETDGNLPTGEPLGEAISRTDELTDGGPTFYMVNCAHPTHVGPAVAGSGGWRERVRGLRCNASRLSHDELDQAEELNSGDPVDFGIQHRRLRTSLPNVRVLGGCCGTDRSHVAQLRDAWLAP